MAFHTSLLRLQNLEISCLYIDKIYVISQEPWFDAERNKIARIISLSEKLIGVD